MAASFRNVGHVGHLYSVSGQKKSFLWTFIEGSFSTREIRDVLVRGHGVMLVHSTSQIKTDLKDKIRPTWVLNCHKNPSVVTYCYKITI